MKNTITHNDLRSFFRIWVPSQKQMIYPVSITCDGHPDKGVIHVSARNPNYDEVQWKNAILDQDSTQQHIDSVQPYIEFTSNDCDFDIMRSCGSFDKNDVMIYQGDILMLCGESIEALKSALFYRIVTYTKGSFYHTLVDKSTLQPLSIKATTPLWFYHVKSDLMSVQVIGNIYQGIVD